MQPQARRWPRRPRALAQTLIPTFMAPMSLITIFHNPACSNSRGALALIEQSGLTPTVVEYLKQPLGQDALRELVGRLGIGARGLLREKEALAAELGLLAPEVDDETLLAAMAQHPVLMNRPVVVTPVGAALCRPPEKVLALLSSLQP